MHHDVEHALAAYREYNRILRLWFVAFGVGGPVLFLTNAAVARQITSAGNLRWVASLFLAGAALQILGAFINKVANYYVYESCKSGATPIGRDWRYRTAHNVVERFWIDFTLDLLSIVFFGWAAWELITAFG